MVIGPIRSLLLLVYGPVTAIRGWDGEALLVFLLTLSLWVWVLARLSPGTSGQERNRPAPTSWLRPPMPRGLHALLVSSRAAQLFLTGIVLLALGYALAFTHFPPTAVVGRGTSVHLAATIGGSVLFASLASGLLLVARAPWMRACVVALLSVYFSLLVAYHLTIQRDFAKSWEIQRAFWTSVAALAPDLADGTVLIFESESPSETRFIDTNSWADPLVLRHIYRFPNGWQNPPRLFTVERGWTRRVQAEDDRLHWWVPAATWNEHWEDLPDSNVILLRRVDGRLTRIDGSIALQGKMLMLKPREPRASGQWEKGPLYGYLIDSRLDSPRQASPSG
jgi:hypothetical protein